jgi:beta-glucosidase
MIKRTWMIPLFSLALSCAVSAQTPSPDQRAFDTEQKMTDDERFTMLFSLMGVNGVIQVRDPLIPARAPMSAGYVSGVPRLGVPALIMSDGSLGITNPGYRKGDTATALPAGLALGSSFNPQLARAAGAMLGREARSRGFNVQLAGGTNLTRDPRNGRNYEYLSEDPWHSAVLAAETINGVQSEGVISTIKHYTLNVNETNRHWLDAIIDPAALRESDLLAFQIAIERSQPGAIMCGYNKVNGEADCGNNHLLNDVLKRDWGYKGWVMSDWGATQNWDFALKGLDQESGAQFDKMMWGDEYFVGPLKQAYAQGKLPKERLSDMVRRMLRSIYAGGVDQWGPSPKVDMASDNQIALDIARQGIVLLKNEGVLPLAADTTARIAVIGGYAQLGVPSGAGSSTVLPPGGYAAVVTIGGSGIMAGGRNLYLLPSSPLAELKKVLPKAQIEFDPGQNPAEAALLARRSDVVIVLGVRAESEGFDSPSLALPWGQDAVIQAVAAVNPNTIVLLETGNPVTMPWKDSVKAIIQAWYPGQAGGQAISEIIVGKVNPSGRLPITFPADLAQTPRPELAGLGTPWGTPTTVRYDEGAEVGYRWFAKTGAKPLFAFGHGLSYTTFSYSDLSVTGGETLTAAFTVTNIGQREGADVPQVYLTQAAGDTRMRLLGFERVELKAGESRRVTVTADPRLMARFDAGVDRWRIAEGSYSVALGKSAVAPVLTGAASLKPRLF